MSEKTFDVVVVGAGPAGEVIAGRLADEGLSVAIVESELIGGECSFYACMPSKALLRPAAALEEVVRVPGAREAVTGELDVAASLARRDEVIHDLDDAAQLPWLEDRGIELFRGEGRLDGERVVRVGDDRLEASKAVVLAPGTSARIPPIEGLAEVGGWVSRDGTTSKEVPGSLIVLGGGPVGCELSQAWASFGTDVTLVESSEHLLPREEPFAGSELADGLAGHGVEVMTGAKVESARREEGRVVLELEGGAELEADEILVATGRSPRTEEIGLETVGLEPGEWLETDDHLRVGGREWLYAIGDANHRALLTHMGKYQARMAADNILGGDEAAVYDDERSPRVVYTDPEVAAVGYTVAAAEEKGLAVETVSVSSSGTAGGSFHGKDTPGTSQLVIDAERGIVVGATFVGFETAEWLHAATIATVGEVPIDRLKHAVPAFPSRSEVWLNLLGAYGV